MGTEQELLHTFTNIGTGFTTETVAGPAKYQIHRARVILESGSGTEVALRVSQRLADKEIKLAYSLTSGGIDSIETQDKIVVHTKERDSKANGTGTTYLSVKVDTGSNTQVYVALDIEVLT